MTDLLLRIDSKLTASIPLLIKSSLMKYVLASVLRRSLRTALNKLYWAVSKMMAVTLYSKFTMENILTSYALPIVEELNNMNLADYHSLANSAEQMKNFMLKHSAPL